MRDVRMVLTKIQFVLVPRLETKRVRIATVRPFLSDGHSCRWLRQELRNWDLWGPLVLCLLLAVILSTPAS